MLRSKLFGVFNDVYISHERFLILENFFIGKIYFCMKRLSGTHALHGFVGCVHRLRVSGRDVIPPSRGLSVIAEGLRPCTPYNLAQIECP